MKAVLNRLHLAIRLGGDGFSNTEEIRDGLSNTMLHPSCNVHLPCIPGFDPAVASLRMKGVLCLNEISSNPIWTSPPQLRMQKLITSQLQALRRGDAQLSYRQDFSAMDLLCNNLILLMTRLFDVKPLPTLLAGIAVSGLLLIQPSSSTG
jgi:hypothetical protein